MHAGPASGVFFIMKGDDAVWAKKTMGSIFIGLIKP